MRVYLIGFMGAGKTHWGKVLSRKMGLPFFDLDELIVDAEGRPVAKIFEEDGEEYYRVKEREILNLVTESHDAMILSCGGGAPCFFNNIDYMNQRGVTVWLNTPNEILLGRLRQQREHRPLLHGLNDEELKDYIIKKNNSRKIYYEQARIKVEEHTIKTEDFIKQILHA